MGAAHHHVARQAQARQHTAAYPEVFATSAHKGEGLDALKMQLAALAAPKA